MVLIRNLTSSFKVNRVGLSHLEVVSFVTVVYPKREFATKFLVIFICLFVFSGVGESSSLSLVSQILPQLPFLTSYNVYDQIQLNQMTCTLRGKFLFSLRN